MPEDRKLRANSTKSSHKQPVTLAAGTKKQPAKKRRPRPHASRVDHVTPASTEVAEPMQVETPVTTRLTLRMMLPEDQAIVTRVTQEELSSVYRESYGNELDMGMVMQYVQSAQTRMILVDDQVAGYVSYVADDFGRMNVGSLVISRRYQGNGYGTRIMKYLEQEALAMGMNEIEVFIQGTNTRSQTFVQRLGYVQVQSNQPQTIVMIKTLRPTSDAQQPQ
ncbi:GNAT family N-acetyltransferase [Ferroacidibacillus organovorans]|uniref:N-acetyltransferase domain-containing protein n=1 Tax=Ferroacidibacillus organovorans TaxID=1765683 RepID=A0A101XRF1_9BACL|nr:GNAT family N-acetyltransferase [Ferroacidibacillus organovorans]KUO96179.1 hypothetical protein ATW55_00040 [Ferroacidibacillus organovorans]